MSRKTSAAIEEQGLADDWISTTLGNVLELKRGYDLPKTSRQNGLIPVISSSGVSGTHSEIRVKGPGVVTGRYGTIGKVYFIKEDFWPLNTTLYVKDFKGNDVRFISYFLRQIDFGSCSDKAAVPGVNRNHLHMVNVSIPPLPEQKAIAHVLGTLDDKIELNRKMNETLETMARALFKSWFIDFDPVHAKAAGRQPAGMDAATAFLFPDSFESSPLGPIPKGWRVGVVGEDFNLTMGQSPPGETYNEVGEGIPFFQGRTDFGFRYPSPRIYCTAPSRFANAGDSLVSVRAPVGDINMAMQKCCVGRGVAAIRHKSDSRSYTYYAMRSLTDIFQNFEAEGTVFGCINRDDFKRIKLISPPTQLISAFEKTAFPIDQAIENQILQSRTLSNTRDSLLPKLLSGDLRISNIWNLTETSHG